MTKRSPKPMKQNDTHVDLYPDSETYFHYVEDLPYPDIPNYKFNEPNLIEEIREYIDATYTQHYSGGYQATDIIIDAGHGIGFTLGNVIKYAKRYGKKEGFNRNDLLKMIHYSILALYTHDFNEDLAKEIE